MTDDHLWEIVKDILREVYKETEPTLDFDDVLENPDDYEDGWYTNYTIPRDREQEIVAKHCDKHNLTSKERSAVTTTAILSYGPSTTMSDDDS